MPGVTRGSPLMTKPAFVMGFFFLLPPPLYFLKKKIDPGALRERVIF